MNKTLKKSISILAVLFFMLASVFVLTACGKDDDTTKQNEPVAKFTTAMDVKTSTNALIDEFFETVYNNKEDLGTETTYSVADIQEKINSFAYYVKIGTIENISDVSSISFNGLKFTNDQTFYLSIGNSNQLLDKVFYVEDNTIYVAAPVVAFETVEHSKIKINDTEFDFNLDVVTQPITLSNVAFNAGCVNSAIKLSDTEYDLVIKSGTEYAGLYYEGAEMTDTIITKRVLNGQLNGYGILNPYNGTNGPCSYLYPVGWQTNPADIDVEKFDGSTFDYSLYIANKHTLANVTLNISIDLANVETYDELVEALDGEKSIINLKNDIDVESTLIVNRKVELNLNGKTISNETNIYNLATNSWSIISVRANGNLTVTGNGTIHALENDCYACDVDGGKLVIENGRFIGNISAVYVYEGTAEIKGGEYSIQQLSEYSDYRYTLNLYDKAGTASIVVTGGTFHNFDPANCLAEGLNTNFVASGYTTQLKANTSDVYEVVVAPQE